MNSKSHAKYNSDCDLAIAYRIYPKVSKVPPVFADDKLKLSELCLKSFKDGLGTLKIKLYAILDNCPREYVDLFKKYFNDEELTIIELPFTGNAGTFQKQIEILLEQNHSEYIYLAEDDYFYLPDIFREMLDLMKLNKNIDFVTSYDHLDYYEHKLHRYNSETIETKERTWRTAATTCLTFLTTKEILQKTQDVFLTYTKKNYDASLWFAITKIKILNPVFNLSCIVSDKAISKIILKSWYFGWRQILFGNTYHLWVPNLSLATHMDNRFLAPTVNWQKLFDDNIEKINFI